MATVNAIRPVSIALDDGARVDLRVGLNEDVPDKIKKHSYFKALVADGDVHLVVSEEAEEIEDADEQQEEKPKRGRSKKDKEQAGRQEESAPVETEQDAE